MLKVSRDNSHLSHILTNLSVTLVITPTDKVPPLMELTVYEVGQTLS